jgi:HK97 family phage portal protein
MSKTWNPLKLFTRSGTSILENPNIPIDSPEAYTIFSLPTASNVPVSYRLVMGYPPIRRAVLLIAGYVAKLPIQIQKRRQGSWEVDLEHPAHSLLNHSPNDLYSPFDFRQQLIAYKLLYSNAYAYIFRDEFGVPEELLLLNPETTYITVSFTDVQSFQPPKLRVAYHTTLAGKTFVLDPADVFHLKGPGDGVVGDSLLQLARDSMGFSLALQTHGAKYFANGCTSQIVVEVPVSEKALDKRQQFRDEWMRAYAGVSHSHRPIFTAPGVKVSELGTDNEKSQFLETRQHDLVLVANLLGIPPSKLGSTINTSYASLVADNAAFLNDCLDPHLCEFEQEVQRKLLTETQKKTLSRRVEFNRAELLRMDPKTETDIAISKLNNGLISWEEYRTGENLPPEKAETETWRHPSNIVIEGEEPEPQEPEQPEQPQEQPIAPVVGQTPAAPATSEDDTAGESVVSGNPTTDRSQELTIQIMGRLIKRCQKAVCSGHPELEPHRSVFLEQLAVWPNAETVVDDLLIRMQTEIDALVPEKYPAIFERIDPKSEAQKLWI